MARAGFEPAILKGMSLPGYHLPYLASQNQLFQLHVPVQLPCYDFIQITDSQWTNL
jgi:hypothetical protein